MCKLHFYISCHMLIGCSEDCVFKSPGQTGLLGLSQNHIVTPHYRGRGSNFKACTDKNRLSESEEINWLMATTKYYWS